MAHSEGRYSQMDNNKKPEKKPADRTEFGDDINPDKSPKHNK